MAASLFQEFSAFLVEIGYAVAKAGHLEAGGVVPDRVPQKLKCFPRNASPRNSDIQVAFPAQPFNSETTFLNHSNSPQTHLLLHLLFDTIPPSHTQDGEQISPRPALRHPRRTSLATPSRLATPPRRPSTIPSTILPSDKTSTAPTHDNVYGCRLCKI